MMCLDFRGRATVHTKRMVELADTIRVAAVMLLPENLEAVHAILVELALT
jgi:hypothetical protein